VHTAGPPSPGQPLPFEKNAAPTHLRMRASSSSSAWDTSSCAHCGRGGHGVKQAVDERMCALWAQAFIEALLVRDRGRLTRGPGREQTLSSLHQALGRQLPPHGSCKRSPAHAPRTCHRRCSAPSASPPGCSPCPTELVVLAWEWVWA